MILLLAQLTAGAGTLTGRVVDPDGLPVPGVPVYAYDPRLAYGDGVTGEDGRFSIELPENRYRVRLVPSEVSSFAEQFGGGALEICASPPVLVAEDGVGELPETTLRVGTAVRGVLVRPDGSPVVGARLSAEVVDAATTLAPRSGTSDDAGAFVVSGLPEGVSATVHVEAFSLPDQYLPGVYDESLAQGWRLPGSGGVVDVGTQVLLRGLSAFGTAVDDEGGIPSGTAFAYTPSQLLSTPLDPDGSWRVDGLPAGDVLAWVSAQGLATTYYPDFDRPQERVPGTEGDTVGPLDLVLPPEGAIVGRLRGSRDFTGASVLVYNSDRTVGFGAVVEADGAFRVGQLHEGVYTLQIYAGDQGLVDDQLRDDRGEPLQVEVARGGTTDLGALALPDGARLEGTVVDRYTGSPIYGAYVYVQAAGGGSGSVATSDHDGRYAVVGLPAGAWDVWADYSHYCDDDPDWANRYYPDQVNEVFAAVLELGAGQVVRWDPALPPDRDHDGMDDVWEEENGLDPDTDDSTDDSDGDGFSNLEEFLLGTRPDEDEQKPGCGCDGGVAGRGVGFALPGVLAWRRRRRRAPRGAGPAQPGSRTASRA